MLSLLPWILAASSIALLLGAALLWWRHGRQPQQQPLPTEWTLSARPVFSGDERRVYRQLREALPHHIVLSKLPLVRFCQPIDPQETRFWYELLGSSNVAFAICSANGRVLAAIDLDYERQSSRRSVQIKQSVLAACRVRYLRCAPDQLPSIPELQLMVPSSGAAARGAQPAPTAAPGREALSGAAGAKRRERRTLWQDSGFMQDSFFGTDGRSDIGIASGFGSLRPAMTPPRPDESGGVVADTPTSPIRH
ncbi:MAG: DUF2726 domain-containing protein [Burkholderiales bacterium]|nr:DUF2726 domain-containing protein [Burkholderiales bacterium]